MGFNRYVGTNITTTTAVVTCPADTVITVIGCAIANSSEVMSVVNVKVAGAYILRSTKLYEGSAIVPIGGEQKVVMVAGDTLTVESDNNVDVIVSVLEQAI